MNHRQLASITTYAHWSAREARRSATNMHKSPALPTTAIGRESWNEIIDNHFVHEVKEALQQLMRIINS